MQIIKSFTTVDGFFILKTIWTMVSLLDKMSRSSPGRR